MLPVRPYPLSIVTHLKWIPVRAPIHYLRFTWNFPRGHRLNSPVLPGPRPSKPWGTSQGPSGAQENALLTSHFALLSMGTGAHAQTHRHTTHRHASPAHTHRDTHTETQTHTQRHTHTRRHTHTQRHIQAHTQTHTDTQAHIETHTGTHTDTHRHTHRHTQRHTGIYRDSHRHTITQRHTQAHTHTGTYTDTQRHTQTHTGPPKKERSPVCFESVNFICPTSGAKRTLS